MLGQRRRRWAYIEALFDQCLVFIHRRRLTDVALMVGQLRRRWAYIKASLGQCIVLFSLKLEALNQRCFNVGPASKMVGLYQGSNGSMCHVIFAEHSGVEPTLVYCWSLS